MSEFSFTPNSINLELNDTTSDSPSLQSKRSAMDNSALQLALTESERKTVAEFAKKIDITNPSIVLKYGSSAQKKIASFSDTTLEKVRTKDSGFAGEMLTNLINELNGFNSESTNFLGKSTRKIRKAIKNLQIRFCSISTNVASIVDKLEEHQLVLMQDIQTYSNLYERNQLYFKELSMYILAGQARLNELRKTKLKELHDKAVATNAPEDVQAYNDFNDACNRFEKKLYDLQLTRQVALQMAPQIRLLQNNDSILVDKIQSTIVNTIPLWKSQMLIALGLANAANALRTQQAVNNATNALLLKNAELLKQGTIEVAKESERGIIDIETLTQTNKELIDTISEVQQIQSTGREKRKNAEYELALMEKELKQKLLELN